MGKDRGIVEDKLDYKGGNVHNITTKEEWDQKIEEANKDGKIVSKPANFFKGLQLSVAYSTIIRVFCFSLGKTTHQFILYMQC